jgi:hypothetical protein
VLALLNMSDGKAQELSLCRILNVGISSFVGEPFLVKGCGRAGGERAAEEQCQDGSVSVFHHQLN